MSEPTFPGAVPPERNAAVVSSGVRLHLVEWGDPSAPPLLLCHGMWDHARSFSVLAPLLARRFRVIALDARGHGASEWGHAYTWLEDVRDVVTVMRWVNRPLHLVGHSRGGGQVTDAARALPEAVIKLVSIDGFGPPPFDANEPPPSQRLAQFLEARRQLATRDRWRPYPSLGDLVERRLAQNPRLSREWLRYFAFHAARQDDDGWRWRADPHMAMEAGPWRPEWLDDVYATLRVPLLAIVGSEADTWGPLPQRILDRRLRGVGQLTRRTVSGAGHFVHIECPVATADLILDYLDG